MGAKSKNILFVLLGIFLAIPTSLLSQCLTDYSKIFPDTSLAVFQEYGSAVAIYKDYLAVGSFSNDSLAHNAGLVYLYKMNGTNYEKIAVIPPPEIQENSQFGFSIDLNDQYLIVSAIGNEKIENGDITTSRVYIYLMPLSGWQNDLIPIELSGYSDHAFGYNVHITEDSKNIFIGNLKPDEESIFSFMKGPSGWNAGVSFQEIKMDPQYKVNSIRSQFGKSFAQHGPYLVVNDPSNVVNGNGGAIHVFKDETGNCIDYEPIALLQGSAERSTFFSDKTAVDDKYIYNNSIYVAALSNTFFCAFPKGTEWESDNNAIYLPYSEDTLYALTRSIELIGDEIFVAAYVQDNTDNVFIFHKDSLALEGYIPRRIIVKTKSNGSGFGADSDTFGNQIVIGNNEDEALFEENGSAELYSYETGTLHLVKKLTETFYDGTDHQFGENLLYFNDHLLIGSPYNNEAGTNLGAVYVYKKNGDNWNKTAKILPEQQHDDDRYFGIKIAQSNNDIAIGASGFETSGQVFMYKNTNPEGISLQQDTVLTPPDTMEIYGFGVSVAIENDIMAIAAHKNLSEVRNVLFIYTRNHSGSWTLEEFISLSNVSPLDKGNYVSVDIFNNQILIGNATGGYEGKVRGSGELITKDEKDGKWKITSRFIQPILSQFSRFGAQVKLTNDHIFISDPYLTVDGVKYVGSIYVYTKPAYGWDDLTLNAAQIVPYDSLENGLFGYSFDLKENMLVVGAPYAQILFTHDVTPGATYLIQGLDYKWEETIPLLKVQGESLKESDQYGHGVALSNDDFCISAPDENTHMGHNSGTVYATKMPPLVKIMAPICVKEGSMELFGYPYDGVWDGPGITDPGTGLFDPAIAGIGEHLITYETPNCAYLGKLKITVEPEPLILSTSKVINYSCSDNPVTLSVTAKDAKSYRWYFKIEIDEPYSLLKATTTSSIEVTEKGFYYCQAFGEYCSVNSEPFVIEKLELDINLTSSGITYSCDNNFIDLAVDFTDAERHTWYFRPIASSDFKKISDDNFITISEPGDYACEVTFNSCIFTSDTLNLYNRSLSINIDPVSVICREEQTHNLTGYPEGGIWSGPGIVDQDQGIFDPKFLQNGTYSITYTLMDGICTYAAEVSVFLDIARPLTLNFFEEEICLPHRPVLEVLNSEYYASIEWFQIKENQIRPIFKNISTIEILEFGSYYVKGNANDCHSFSDTITFSPKQDHIFVPNVFTPNGDAFNEDFQIIGDYMAEFYLAITNRWGKIIFETRERDHRWKAEGCTSGVYYYSVNYKDCSNRYKNLNGVLTVIK